MCGIAGALAFDGAPSDRGAVEAMTAQLAHRGPDGSSVAVEGSVALGHTRLAIIDPEGGHQPFESEDGRVTAIVNGEIYNFRELRDQLVARGHRFRSRCDSEVVLHAWEEWGESSVERLRGMFAVAVADHRRRVVFLARDPLGIKPLCYCLSRTGLAFASEIAPLAALPGRRYDLDLEAIDDYLRLRYIPAPRTAYRQIRKLEPGHRLTVTFDGTSEGPREYWRLRLRPAGDGTAEEWAKRLDEALRESVRAHLVADVPFGLFLSGGLDSAAVLSYMSEELGSVRTFTIGFEEAAYDESAAAARLAAHFGAEHRLEIVCPDALAVLPELVTRYGEPFGDPSAIPTYLVSRLARRSVPMVLSGDGGDELFAGYDSYRAWLAWLAFEDVGHGRLRRSVRALASRISPRRFPRRTADLDSWLRRTSVFSPFERCRMWRPEVRPESCAAPEVFRREAARAAEASPLTLARHLDLKTYLPGDVLTKVDVASMAHGLEVRTPFVDVEVLETAAQIPEALLVSRHAGGWEGKALLRRVLAPRLPPDALRRPKQGFAVPIRSWIGTALGRDAEGGSEIQQRLVGDGSELNDLFEPAAVRRALEGEANGPPWLLLFLDEWLRQRPPARR